MNFLILVDKVETEFEHQALDYYHLLEAFIEPGLAEHPTIKRYIDNPRTIELSKVRNFDILAFRPLTPAEVKTIHQDNRLFIFSNGSIAPMTVLTAGAVHAFVTFGSRSAYRLAYNLKAMNIKRPVYKIIPWVNTAGIKEYNSVSFGKVDSTEDIGLRPIFRLMAAKTIVIVPNIDPFNSIIVDGWNGIIYEGELSDLGSSELLSLQDRFDAAATMARAQEYVSHLLESRRYKELFINVLDGGSLDHNEPWIEAQIKGSTSWIIPKETMEGGELIQVPESFNDDFRVMRPITLRQLLDYMTNIRFRRVYVFDILVEELDTNETAQVNKLLKILGNRVHDILFCLNDIPPEWRHVAHKLTFMSPSEASKQVR